MPRPMHEGTVDGDTLICAAHAATFDLAPAGPSASRRSPTFPLYACKVGNDTVLVDVEHQLNDADPS